MGIKTTENKHGFKKYSEVKLIGFKSSSSVWRKENKIIWKSL
jgi:hypothetical protein